MAKTIENDLYKKRWLKLTAPGTIVKHFFKFGGDLSGQNNAFVTSLNFFRTNKLDELL